MKTTHALHIELLKADIYRLLANCFDFPTDERLAAIREISDALSQTDYPHPNIKSMIATLNASMDHEQILTGYTVIFIKGGVPLSESHILQKYNSVPDVSAFYRAFGFSARSGDNPDSIMYQLEFLALLLVKMTTAPDEETADIVQEAYGTFLVEHTAEFAIGLAQRIRSGNAGPYFSAVTDLLEAFIRSESLTTSGVPAADGL